MPTVDLTWSKVDNRSIGGWHVERSADSGSSWTIIADALSPSTTTYTDSNVTENDVFVYRVRRYTEHTDAYSNETTVTVPTYESVTLTFSTDTSSVEPLTTTFESAAITAVASTDGVFVLPLSRIGIFANDKSEIGNRGG